jgi:hypothetical protein
MENVEQMECKKQKWTVVGRRSSYAFRAAKKGGTNYHGQRDPARGRRDPVIIINNTTTIIDLSVALTRCRIARVYIITLPRTFTSPTESMWPPPLAPFTFARRHHTQLNIIH